MAVLTETSGGGAMPGVLTGVTTPHPLSNAATRTRSARARRTPGPAGASITGLIGLIRLERCVGVPRRYRAPLTQVPFERCTTPSRSDRYRRLAIIFFSAAPPRTES